MNDYTDTDSNYCEEGASMAALRGVLTDDEIEQLRQRNQERVQAAQRDLGHRWVLYPTRAEAMQ